MSGNHSIKLSDTNNHFMQQFLGRIPPETAATFTNTQLTELKRVLSNRLTKYHIVDIRISIPLLKQRFYVVLLIGREKHLKNLQRI